MSDASPLAAAVVERLERATNDRDLDALVACFASGYRNETPAHPERGFSGRDQVRRNWTQIFGAIADLRAKIRAIAVDGETVWTEWEHRGTRPDGSAHVMRGVVIFEVGGDLIRSARFYLEPVEEGEAGIDAAVRRQVSPEPAR